MCNLLITNCAYLTGVGIVTNKPRVDAIDARIIKALSVDPRATVIALADATRLSRNTVQARLSKLENQGVLRSLERRIDPAALGYPLTAFILTRVTQRKLAQIADSLEQVPEVIEVHGLAGVTDLMIHVVAREADDLYRIAGRILDIDGVEQTTTSLVMRKLVDYRITPLLDDLTQEIRS
ncbi:Lrp/AsnC family transcriptional regulator [Mycolicibacterium goodii]|uniref:Lrp/AsnC family transcriptional regulator n=1 Tax=Mycolicibacterium goodii TaxID=134601 RepID=A0ABS6HWL1_MYCGD|nr:Lrp/AsnC family transcriptional regulator [Mycolicibacterium goodii]MBU8816638.1 Lrp/AsnC family transcriptional regulator [Mycolicibacterium goodii]MBU8826330.1 Lrp/AsnC family transcriptional regulator [Mycolicibacterium goodii]MBU8828785.1 Lrp/AsnC family transcriptional regulator [Mycolicibacterium goodii]MBU8839703.1 Lrp/AsnC family transcriptional regulator [Mycolicibacterium goodii]